MDSSASSEISGHGFDSSSDEDTDYEVDTSPLSLSWLDLAFLGYSQLIGISALPGHKFRGKKRNLTKDIATLQEQDVRDVFLLVTNHELRKYRVPNLIDSYAEAGIEARHYPTLDGTVLEISALKEIIEKVMMCMGNGHRILIQCFGGLGRSCLVAACLLLYLDETMTPSSVIDRLRSVRGSAAVQTVKQYNCIHEFRKLLDEFTASNQQKLLVHRSVSR